VDRWIARHPAILAAVDPRHALAFFASHGTHAFVVLGAVVLFGIILKAVGMLAAGAILVFIASMGSRDFRWRQSLILGVILVIFCALVFVWGLKLPIPLCPDIESLQSSVGFCRG